MRITNAIAVLATVGLAMGAPGAARATSGPFQSADEGTGTPGWLSSWSFFLGGFRQLDGLALDGIARGWAYDITDVGNESVTLFLRFEGVSLRVTQMEAGTTLSEMALDGHGGGAAVGRADPARSGVVWALSNGRWSRVYRVPAALQAVAYAPDGGTAWAVGDSGTVLRWSADTGWVVESFPDGLARLIGVGVVDAEDAWAVDDAGVLFRRDPMGWSALDAPKADRPRSMALNGAGNGLVVGRNALELADGVWREIEAPAPDGLDVGWSGSVAYVAAGEAVFAYQGGSWTAVALPTTPIDMTHQAVDLVAGYSGAAYAAARDGTVARIGPDTQLLWPGAGRLRAIDAHLADAAWATGSSPTSIMVGSEPREGLWDHRVDTALPADLTDVTLLDANEGWAVGETTQGMPSAHMWHKTAAGWREESVGADWGLTHVAALTPTDAWSSGRSYVARWNGDSWKPVEEAPTGRLTGPLVMERGGQQPQGWFGGWGEVVRLDAAQWLTVTLPSASGAAVIDLDGDPSGGVWALTSHSVTRVLSDTTTVSLPDPPGLMEDAAYTGLGVTASGDTWLLVYPNGLYRWADDHWEPHGLGPLAGRVPVWALQAVDYVPPDAGTPPVEWSGTDVWLVGADATVARYRAVVPSYNLFLPILPRGRMP